MSADLPARAVVADTHNDLLMAVVERPPERWTSFFREQRLFGPELGRGSR